MCNAKSLYSFLCSLSAELSAELLVTSTANDADVVERIFATVCVLLDVVRFR